MKMILFLRLYCLSACREQLVTLAGLQLVCTMSIWSSFQYNENKRWYVDSIVCGQSLVNH